MKLSNYVKVFRALANEQRLALFLMIYKHCSEGKHCSGHKKLVAVFTRACGCMAISRSTISHHLKELKNAGLIRMERSGQQFHCYVNPAAVKIIREFLA